MDYKRATLNDLEELVRTRIIVLRAANKLDENTDISLEVTDMGRLLYEKYGFVKMNDEMELQV
jgi:hypothetical protein